MTSASASTPRARHETECFEWLGDGGESGALIRAHDWRRSSLGPPDRWPQSLRTALSICLSSRFPMAVCWGRSYDILYNDAYSAILGSKHPGALGRPCFEVWNELAHIVRPMFDQVIATGEATWSADLMLPMHRHGYLEEAYFTVSYSAIRGESGGPEGILVTVAETTERFLAERRLRLLRELGEVSAGARSPRQAIELIATILERHRADVPFALLYEVAADAKSARLAATSGLDRGHPAAPDTIELEAAPNHHWPIARALGAQPEARVDAHESWPPLPGGIWPEPAQCAVLHAIPGPGGTTPIAVLIAGVNPRRTLDATHEEFFRLVARQIANTLGNAIAHEETQKRIDALAEIDRAKTAFFSNVSHEFRTPLTLMLGPIEELLADQNRVLDPKVREELTLAHRNSLRLLKLVNSLLDFSRLEAGRMEASYEPVDLGALTADLAVVFRSAAEKAGLRLRIDCAPGEEAAYVDRDMWEKIVFNLLSNALKFTLQGEIAVSVRRVGGHFELAVADTGVGIRPEDIAQLFQRFHRIESPRSRTHEGTGIGLALVRELTLLHGGDVGVTSELGRGSTFTVMIPAGREHLPADRIRAPRTAASTRLSAASFTEEATRWIAEPGQNVPADSPPPGHRPRVLIADDNADMRDYMHRLIGPGFEVETVADGQTALAAMRRNPPEVVLADVMMPGLDGLQMLRLMRMDPELRGLPVILVSARAGYEASSEGYDAGADDYLIKPFTGRELLSRVNGCLRRIQHRRQVERRERSLSAELETLVEAVPAVVWIARDQECRVVIGNRASYELLRLPPTANVSLSAPERPEHFVVVREGRVLSPDELPVQRAARGEEVRDFEEEVRFADGTLRYLIGNASPLRDEHGNPCGAVAAFMDVTERRRFERNATLLAAINENIATVAEERELLTATARLVAESLGVERCEFAEWAAESSELRPGIAWQRDDATSEAMSLALLPGPAAWRRKLAMKLQTLPDVRDHEEGRAHAGQGITGSFASAPFVREGLSRAIIYVAEARPRVWQPEDRALLEGAIARVWPVVERFRATTAMREGEERFRAIADSIAALAWTTDPAGTPTWYNQRWYDYTGTTLETITARGWERLVEPRYLERVKSSLFKSLESGEPWESTFPLRGEDGTYRWFLSRAVPMRDNSGRIVRWFGTSTDITNLRVAEEALHQRTRTLELLNRAAASLTEVRNLQKIVQAVTDAGREISGAAYGAFFHNVNNAHGESYTLYTLSGAPREAFERMPMPRNTELFAPTFRGEGAVRIGDVRRHPAFGRNAPHHGLPADHLPVVSYLAVPVKSPSGEVLGGLFFGHPEPDVFTVAAERAVTALAAQAAVAIENANLYTASRRLAAIVETSDDAILSTNLEGVLTTWNRGAERMFGYTAQEMVGRSILTLLPADRQQEEAVILGRIGRGETIDHFETERKRKDGTTLHVSLSVSPLRDNDGRVVGASKIARDITLQSQARETMEKLVQERTASLRAAISQMEEFSYTVSHDLRSPARAMRGYAEVLLEDYGDRLDDEGRRLLDRIIRGSGRMDQLIRDLLTYSRLTRREIVVVPVSLERLVREIVQQYPEMHPATADIEIESPLPDVLAHEPSLMQAVSNLLRNAVKFVAPGVRPRVRVSGIRNGDTVRLSVRDNGIGIRPEHQHRIFGMFERIHPDSVYEGTGIGLAIVRKAMERMNGSVGMESDGVNGSLFWLELPAATNP